MGFSSFEYNTNFYRKKAQKKRPRRLTLKYFWQRLLLNISEKINAKYLAKIYKLYIFYAEKNDYSFKKK